ncbi:hypothetical protein [Flavobacterium limnophilum]|uniref:hypothetical protein n=1 Tax=Flavobacterium limnophilum TaxID=3003262 RepID=UPI0022ABE482|nr:hypothetical protein [Flavobacterium limnophilum]
MKNLGLFCLLLASIVLGSCNKKPKDVEVKNLAEKPVSVQCYKALYETDTLDLKVNTLKNGKVTGELVMKVLNKAKKVGKIAGEFRGDTLFVDYSFVSGLDKATYKNPMALLKKGNELILGNGKIETYLGTSYFAKGQPIDFDNVKYKFTAVECVDK